MNRLTEIQILDKSYPLNFSTKAAAKVYEEYGGFAYVDNLISGKDENGNEDISRALAGSLDLLEVLAEQGAAYEKIAGRETPPFPRREELEVVLGVPDLTMLQEKIIGAMHLGITPTVEVEPDTKNEKTTQAD